MKKMDEQWLKKVKESLRDYEEPIPVGGWEKLERGLSTRPKLSIYEPRKRYIAVAAVFLLLISSAWIISLYISKGSLDEAVLPVIVEVAPDPYSVPDGPEVPASTIPSLQDRQGRKSVVKTSFADVWVVKEIVTDQKETEIIPKEESAVFQESGEELGKEEIPESQPETVVRRKVTPSSKEKLHLPVSGKKEKEARGWSVGLAMANGTGISGAGDNYMEYNRLSFSAMATGGVTVDSDALVVRENSAPYVQKLQDIDYNHRQPITAGISVRKDLSRGLSLETGLMYTFLASDASIDNEYVRKQEQKLHYLGIPLKANWTFWEKNRFSLYVAGGGMVEKSVSGETSYVFTEAGKEMNTGENSYQNSNLNVKELQWSLSAAAGAQYHINRYMGIYVEPGIAYYFDDGSDIQTIRKERPFNFNLQVGFRFSY